MELFTGYAVVLEGDKFPRSCRRRMRLAYLGLFFNGLSLTTGPLPRIPSTRGEGGEWVSGMN